MEQEQSAPSDQSAAMAEMKAWAESSVRALLGIMVSKDASDLHLAVGLPPMYRLSGKLQPVPDAPQLTPPMTEHLVQVLMNPDQQARFAQERDLDFSYDLAGAARFRVNAFRQKGCVSAALRKIPTVPKPLEELGLPPAVMAIGDYRQGLVLVTGPTGSGKSTTLAAIIDRINRERAEHIITIEDPIEFQHSHKQCVIQQREVGEDTLSFARALKSILRQDPDVVLIGEMRDLETIAAAVTTAETGHLVFGTLHTNSAGSTIDRILDVFPPHQQPQIRTQLAATLRAVISQRLVPTKDGKRACVAEVLIGNDAVANLIRKGDTAGILSAMQTSKGQGMTVFDSELAQHVRQGTVDMETAISYANAPKTFAETVRPSN